LITWGEDFLEAVIKCCFPDEKWQLTLVLTILALAFLRTSQVCKINKQNVMPAFLPSEILHSDFSRPLQMSY